MIRRLTLNDLENCTDLYVKVFNAEPWNDGWKKADAQERLDIIFSHKTFLGLGYYHDDELLGFLLGYKEKWLDSYHYYIPEMCVKPFQQGRGIGSSLLEYIETIASDEKMQRVYLLTAKGTPAESFYIKNGFYQSPRMIMMAKKM